MTELLSLLASVQIWGLGIFILLIISVIADSVSSQKFLRDIPTVGRGRDLISRILDSRDYLFSGYHGWMIDGYRKYNKKGLPFLVPGPLSRNPEVALPQSQLAWMFDQPDHIMSAEDARYDIAFPLYNFLGHRMATDVFGIRVLYKSLARHLPALLPDIDYEIQQAVEANLGNDADNWKMVNILEFWMSIVPRATNRMLVGPQVCRDKQFIDAMVNYATVVVINSALLRLIPRFLHPILGRLLGINSWRHWHTASKRVMPLMQDRLHRMTRQAAGDYDYKDYVPPEDFITWLIRLAMAEGKTFELDARIMSKRLLPIELAGIHTTVLSGQLWTIDLLTSDPQIDILNTLRLELQTHRPESRSWDRASLSSLFRLDSSIRESLRFSNFSLSLVKRLVVADKGVYNPDLDLTFPKGTTLVANTQGIQRDADIFENPNSYDPLRYYRQKETWDEKSDDEKRSNPAEEARVRGLGVVTTSDSHLAFSHGRHACPGRFFFAYETKLIMAHLLLNYDVKLMGEPPERKYANEAIVPSMGASMQIRRRKTVVA